MNNLKKLNRGGKSIGLLLFLFLLFVGHATAKEITIDFSQKNYSDASEVTSVTESDVTITFDKGTGNTPPKYYKSGTAVRVYSKGYFTVEVPNIYKITSITLTYGSSDTSSKITTDVGTFSTNSWTPKETDNAVNSVKFTVTGTGQRRIKAVTVTYEATSTGPAINADDVTYAADVTKGEISYTISNASGSTMTAKPLTTWINNVVTLTGHQKVTFDMEENTATEPREGVIELTYGTLTKEVKVTQLAAVAKRTVTIIEPENGTLQILRDGEEVVSGSQVPEGTVLTAVVTPNEGYKFDNWIATDGSTHTYTANFTYTVGKSDVTFKANFKQIIYNTIKWSVNGVTTTETVEQGTDITFTAPTTIPEGYVFTGWYGGEYTNATTAPEYVTSATATEDVTYYAVFAKSEGKEETATLTATHTKDNTSYIDRTYTDDKNQTWTSVSIEPYEKNTARFGINKTSGHYFKSPTFSGNVINIEMEVYNGSSKDNRTFYFDSQQATKNGDLGTIAVAKGEQFVVKTATLTGDFNQFYINASDALSFTYIKVTYGNITFSDFRTSVSTTPTTATISISSACTDGSFCYGTFSSTKAFIASDDIIVSEINITEEGELLVETYKPGAVVPANTGVMVSALAGDNYEVELTDEAGTSVLGDSNMLRPTGAGITADQMATADPNCLYYRLTMHQGETLGFFWGAADGAAFNVAAGKAYLAVPVTQAARVNGFVLGGGTSTGIDSIADSMAAQRTVYNLQGQRVSGRLAKGVYIVNGKKVIIK